MLENNHTFLKRVKSPREGGGLARAEAEVSSWPEQTPQGSPLAGTPGRLFSSYYMTGVWCIALKFQSQSATDTQTLRNVSKSKYWLWFSTTKWPNVNFLSEELHHDSTIELFYDFIHFCCFEFKWVKFFCHMRAERFVDFWVIKKRCTSKNTTLEFKI